jgi:hypothetical protein
MLVLLLPGVLGQRSTRSSSASTDAADVVFWLVFLAVFVGLYLVYGYVMSRIHRKAGNPPWWGFVPIVNEYGLIKLAGREPWWLLLYFIPCVNIIPSIIIPIDVAKSFGKDALWAVGLIFLPFIFFPILAFGNARYLGPAYGGSSGRPYPPPGYGPGPPPNPYGGQQPPYG